MRMQAERPMLMLPMNVVMVGRITGELSFKELNRAVAALSKRHALLAVRVAFERRS